MFILKIAYQITHLPLWSIRFMQINVTLWNKTVITFHKNMSHVPLLLNECKWHNSIKLFITTLSNIKTLGININDSLNWRGHIKCIIPKLSSACYIMRSIRSYMSLNVLKTIYYSYFNTIMSYGLIFWGNSPHSLKIFRMQKKKNNKNHDGLQE
jgi:hypothetical protein